MTIPLNRVRQIIREEVEGASSEPFLPDDRVSVISATMGHPVEGGYPVKIRSGYVLTVTKEISSSPHGNMVAVAGEAGDEFYVNPADLARQ